MIQKYKEKKTLRIEKFLCFLLLVSFVYTNLLYLNPFPVAADEANQNSEEVIPEGITPSPTEGIVSPSEDLSSTEEIISSDDPLLPEDTSQKQSVNDQEQPVVDEIDSPPPFLNTSSSTTPSLIDEKVGTSTKDTLPVQKTSASTSVMIEDKPPDTPTSTTTEETTPYTASSTDFSKSLDNSPTATSSLTFPESLNVDHLEDLISVEKISLDEKTNPFASTTKISTKTAELILPGRLSLPMIVRYKNRTNKTPLEISIKEASIESILIKRETNHYFYQEAFTDTDLQYEITKNGIKESIVLKGINHPTGFQYQVNSDQFDFVQTSPNTVVLYKKGEEDNPLAKLYTLSAPKMTDSAGRESTDITFTLQDDTLILTPDADWLSEASYPVVIDPTIEITVLNVHSHPVEGEYWNVDFTTVGTADLTITPADQETIDDMEFISLSCDGVEVTPQLFPGDVIFYHNWSCDGIATVSHLDLKTGKHHLIFEFSNATEEVFSEAFNATITWKGTVDSNWGNNLNWSPSTAVPGTTDLAYFDNTCTGCNVTIGSNIDVGGISIASTYTGTITQSAGVNVTVRSSGYTQAGGTFQGSTGILDTITGAFNLSGGTFNAASSTLVDRNFTFSGGTFNGAGGNITLDGSEDLDITFTCTGDFNATTGINSVSITKSVRGGFVLVSDCTLTANMNTTSDQNSGFIINGTFTDTGNFRSGPLTINGTLNINGTTFYAYGGLIVNSTTTLPNVTSFTVDMGHFTNNSELTLAAATIFNINGNLTNTASGTISYGGTNINIGGSWTQDGTFNLVGKDLTFYENDYDGTLNCVGDFNVNTGINSVTIAKSVRKGLTLAAGCTLTGHWNTTNDQYASDVINGDFYETGDFRSGPLTVNGNLTVATGTTFYAHSGFTNNGTSTLSTVTSFTVQGVWGAFTNSGYLNLPVATTFAINNANFTNATSGEIIYNGTNLSVGGNWTQNGTFDLTGKNLTLDSTGVDVNATFYCVGNFNANTGINSVSITKSVRSGFILVSGCTLYANMNTTSDQWAEFTINGDFYETGNFRSSYLTVNGNLTVATGTTFYAYSGFVNNGTTTLPTVTSFTVEGVWHSFSNSGYLNIPSGTTFELNNVSLTNNAGGTIIYGGTNLNVERNFTNDGTLDLTDKTVIFDGPSSDDHTTFTCPAGGFSGSVKVNKTSTNTFSFANDCAIAGSITRTDGAISNPSTPVTISLQGDLSVSTTDNFGGANLTNITFSGANNQTLTYNGPTLTVPILVSKTGGTVSLGANFSTGSTLEITSGDFDAASKTTTVSGLTTVSGGTYIASSSTQTLNGGLTVSGGTFTGGTGTIDINGNLTQTDGTITFGGNVTLAGNLAKSGGTLTASAGTFTLDNTNQTISGNSTFYNLTKIATTTSTLTFEAGSLQTITNTLILQGITAGTLSLRSSSEDNQWNIDPQGTRSVAYLDVQDSNNNNPLVLNAIGTNSVSSGNNTNWIFTNPTYTQSDYRFYENTDNLQPSTSLGYQSTATTIFSTSTPVRLRMNIVVGANDLPINFQQFRLQVSTATTTGWADVMPREEDAWWNTSWQNRRKITFDSSSVTENLTDFPVLVSLEATTTGNIDYSKTKAAGADVRFVDAGNTTDLNYEIEKWDTSATSSIWVKVPQINSATTTDYIWMYYNNSSATDNSTTTGVWNENFKSVWHMHQTPASGGTQSDSTRNNKTATFTDTNGNSNTNATGIIDGADDLNGDADYYSVASPALPTTDFSYSAWVNLDTNYDETVFMASDGSGGNELFVYMTTTVELRTNNVVRITGATTIATSSWYYITVTRSGSDLTLYVNGVSDGIGTDAGALSFGACALLIGADADSSCVGTLGNYLDGRIDELRISGTARSASWIGAEYKTMNGTFNTYGGEESQGSDTWLFYNNASVASGTPISATLLSTSNVRGSYMESNPTASNPFAALIGELIEYDFVLDVSNIIQDVTYYFRMITENSTVFDSYTYYPTLTMTPNNTPDVPASLGPTSLIDGSWTTDNTPTLTFSLSDSDVGDTLKYQIQIDDTLDFSSPVVDYTSALAVQGARSFTVGQAEGSGTYTVGAESQTLPDSSGYYWRVLAIDDKGSSSSYETANSGDIAFKVDATVPTSGTLSVSVVSDTSLTASISGASDSGSGLSATPYIFYNLTAGTDSGATADTSWDDSGLSPGTTYTYEAAVYDVAGNSSVTASANSTTSGGGSGSGDESGSGSGSSSGNDTGSSGGGAITYGVTINDGQATTASSVTSLTLTAPSGIQTMILSNTPDFSSIVTLPYQNFLAYWNLCEKNVCQPGIYTVYVKFYGASSVPSPVVTDDIYLSVKSKMDEPPGKPPRDIDLGVIITASQDGEKYFGSLANVPINQSVYLQGSVAGMKPGDKITYKFDCQNDALTDGVYEAVFENTPRKNIKTGPICSFNQQGTYLARVEITSKYSTVFDMAVISVGQQSVPPAPPTPPIPPETEEPPVVEEPPVIPPPAEELPDDYPIADIIEETIDELLDVISDSIADGVQATHSALINISARTASLAQGAVGVAVKVGKAGQEKLARISADQEVSAGISTLVIAPSVLVLQYSLGTQITLLGSIKSLTDAWFIVLGLLQGLFSSIGLRARRRYWGTVYDSQTKQPIDPAIVELIDADSGKVVEQSVTDLSGRFGFLDREGRYFIRARKTHYTFPSKIVTGSRDSIFENIYHGELIKVTKTGDLLAPNIPMDSVAFDWNQQEKQKIIKFHPNLELTIQVILNILFWLGFALIMFNFISHHSLLNGMFVSIYVLLIALKRFLPNQKLWGRVTSKDMDTQGLLLEINPVQVPQVTVARAMTAKGGRFFLKTSEGEYILKIKKIDGSNLTSIYESQVSVGKDRVLNDIIEVPS